MIGWHNKQENKLQFKLICLVCCDTATKWSYSLFPGFSLLFSFRNRCFHNISTKWLGGGGAWERFLSIMSSSTLKKLRDNV